MQNVSGAGSSLNNSDTVKSVGSIRVNFASTHLRSAVYSALKVDEVEKANLGKEFSAFFEEISTNCVACLWFCTSCIESYVNELFITNKTCFPEYPAEFIEVIHDSIDRREVLDKLNLIVKLKTGQEINRGFEPWQSLNDIIKIRNALIHFKPEWSNELDEHEKLNLKMKSKIPLSPFMKGKGIDIFPNSYLSMEFCKWCIKTIVSAMDFIEPKVNYIHHWPEFRDAKILGKIAV